MRAEEFDRMLTERTREAEEIIGRYLPWEEGLQREVIEAMNYSLLAGGKRLRPVLMQEVYRMCGGKPGEAVERFMAAIEMIHTYSLVHDDLPAMDNDEERRGKKTTWYVYGEALGILAGDGLLNYAFETAIGALSFSGEGTEEGAAVPERVAKALAVLANKAGIYGMIGGQTLDVSSEAGVSADMDEKMKMEELLFIHEHKTAALIQAAMMIGAILAGAGEEQTAALEKCACNIGLAFQIQDDILDVVGDQDELGKPTGSDALNHRQTYVTVKGLEQSRADVDRLSREAVALLDIFSGEKVFLEQLIVSLTKRRK